MYLCVICVVALFVCACVRVCVLASACLCVVFVSASQHTDPQSWVWSWHPVGVSATSFVVSPKNLELGREYLRLLVCDFTFIYF